MAKQEQEAGAGAGGRRQEVRRQVQEAGAGRRRQVQEAVPLTPKAFRLKAQGCALATLGSGWYLFDNAEGVASRAEGGDTD